MSKQFSLDLKVARRKSGLTQADCAHLLGCDPSRISRLEQGTFPPSASDIALLTIIYGKAYDAFCPNVFQKSARDISERMLTLKAPRGGWLGRFNRTNTLDKLDARLDHIITTTDEPE